MNSRAHAKRLPADSQLAFRRKLARGMLQNKLDSEVQCPGSPAHTRKRSSGFPAPAHEFCTCPKFTRAWDLTKNKWSYVNAKYLKTRCSGCSFNVRSYCSRNKKATLCTKCWGSINNLRASPIKINLLVIVKLTFFDYCVANSSSISMVPIGIFGLGVCRLVPSEENFRTSSKHFIRRPRCGKPN